MGAEIVDHGWKKIQQNIKTLQKTDIKVGLIGGKADGHVIEYAGYNEFGTSRIKPRPFMRQTFEENESKMKAAIAAAYVKVQNGAEIYKVTNDIGRDYKGFIQREIIIGGFEANAKSTVYQKGSSQPLIGGYKKKPKGKKSGDPGGRMRQSIEFEVK